MIRALSRLLALLPAFSPALSGCDSPSSPAAPDASPSAITSAPAPIASGGSPAASESAAAADASAPDAMLLSTAAPGAADRATCPAGMKKIEGGVFWVGTDYDMDEAPRHQWAVKSFCMDETEVTVAAYQACVQEGKCQATHKQGGCTAHAKQDLSKHPVNCVDWNQADAACKAWGKRLPGEHEWEFAACGGPERRRFSWGADDPEGRSCYNKPSTCPVGSYAAGAFGLHDMSGNLWEWTGSWFGSYPDEPETGSLKVYRGGSYSRRYPRWMRTGLRNRFKPGEFGAHLGFRCAADLAGIGCPAGTVANGSGCDIPGVKKPAPRGPGWTPPGTASAVVDTAPPVVSRDPRFDADCEKYKPGRPVCYYVKGGQFAERQKIGGGRGCVNRDVGIGYNSICCPQ